MVAQRRYRVSERRRYKREGRERQNPEEKRPNELQEAMLLRRESSIVSCAQQTRATLFFADIVFRTTIERLCNRWSERCPSKVTTQKTISALSDTRALQQQLSLRRSKSAILSPNK